MVIKKYLLLVLAFFTGGLFAQTYNMPGGTINTCSGTFYDTGGGAGGYLNNENITTTFCSNAGNCIRVTFTSFDTESGWDFLRIYDGPTTASPLIGTYSGLTSPGTVTSTSGCLTFWWTSDGSVTYTGWAATISCVACVSSGYNMPGGTISTCSGNFYDTGGSGGNYANSENVTTTFCSNAGNCVQVSFSAFNTEAGFDVLRIYDGPTTASPLLGSYSGTTSPGVVTSTTGCLTFWWTSDGSVVSSGWAATISCVSCVSSGYNMPGGTINTCSGNFYDTGGGGGNYLDNQNITTTFCSNAGNCVQVAFSAFNTEACCDFLQIYDGPTTASPLIGTYSGVTSPGTVTSTSGCLTFRWTSDGSVVSSGWAATITCVACPPPPPPFCYTSGAIAYNPSPVAGTSLVLGDDQYSPVVNIGFSFCFDGVSYTQCLISSNNYVDFDLAGAGGYSPWSIAGPIPTSNPVEIMRSILAPWEDILPPAGGTISYQTVGVAPNRVFIVNWFQVPMFSCTGQLYTSQLKLYETTNCIEMHMGNKPICNTWNGGLAIQGINNATGTQGWAPPGRNATQWSVTNDGMMIWPTCAPCNSNGPCVTVVLPIELLSFEGECNNGETVLRWATATETDNDYFTIERTSDGANFEEIGRVDGAGNSNEVMNYSFTDDNLLTGTTYYRLKQTDFNGQYEYSYMIPVTCSEMRNVSIKPNPGSGEFTISGVPGASDITVTNVLGEVVFESKGNSGEVKLDLSGFERGIYFVNISSAYESYTEKIILE